MIRLLGDFSIDEAKDKKFSPKEIVALAYALFKGKDFYINELVDVLSEPTDEIEKGYVKKIINNLLKKLEGVVNITVDKMKVRFTPIVAVDVIELEKCLSKIQDFGNLEEGLVDRILEIYSGHFLPFIDNIWVKSVRNVLKTIVLKVVVRYFYSQDINSPNSKAIMLKIAKLIPELYLSSSTKEMYNYLEKFAYVNVGLKSVEDLTRSNYVKVIKLQGKDLQKLIRNSTHVDLIDSNEFIMVFENGSCFD
ncbi:MAG: hypothetical protein ACP5KD_04070 [Fervidobacterium sp.]